MKGIIGILNSILWNKIILHETKQFIFQALFQSTAPYDADI